MRHKLNGGSELTFFYKLAGLFAVVALCASCGGSRYSVGSNSGTQIHDPDFFGTGTGGSGGSDGGVDPFSGDDEDEEDEPGTGGGELDPYQFLVEGVGYENSNYIEIPASEILRVQFAPHPQNTTVQDSGYPVIYGLLGFYFKIRYGDGEEVEIQSPYMLHNGLLAEAQKSPIEDLSFYADESDGMVEITITKVNYDYNILVLCNYGLVPFFDPACSVPWIKVLDGHPWNGTLFVQTEDTKSLESIQD